MKYNLPCEIVKDLLPLYIEGLADDVTAKAVEEHLAECENCRAIKNQMADGSAQCDEKSDSVINSGDEKDGEILLKNIKKKLNKKNKIVIICSICVIVVAVLGFQLLFNLPVKNVDLKDVSVSAEVYSMDELLAAEEINGEEVAKIEYSDGDETEGVAVSMGEDDDSEVYTITIPDMNDSEIQVSANTAENCQYVSVISWSSPYFLREISYGDQYDEDTLYVEAIKTTLLNNKTPQTNQTMTNLEFRQINKIVFVGGNGEETTLWEK